MGSAEDIVRLLADSDPIIEDELVIHLTCALCKAWAPAGDAIQHKGQCPYQLALVWVEGDGKA